MSEGLLTALLALAGTLAGTFGGILTSSRLTNYRLAELEKKVAAHNNLDNRLVVAEEQLKSIKHRVTDLEAGRKE